MRTVRTAALLALTLPLHLSAQQVMDAGTFVLTRGGTEAGREEFVIRTTATGRDGSGLLAISTARVPGREIEQALELNADFTPVTYRLSETAGGRVVRRVNAQFAGPRLSARVVSDEGELARELPARGRVVVLSENAASAFYFVPRAEAGETRSVTVLRTRDVRTVPGTVTYLGPDSVVIGGRAVPTLHYQLRLDEADWREFWFTPSGDLVQVVASALGMTATRSQLPER